MNIPRINTPDGLFHNGNVLTGEPGTIVTAEWLNAVQAAFRSQSFFYESSQHYRTGEIRWFADDEATPLVGNFYEAYHPDGCLGKDPRNPTNRPDGWASSDPSAPYYWLKLGKVYTPSAPGRLETWETKTIPQNRILALPDALNASKFWRLALAKPNLVSGGQIVFPADVRGQTPKYLDETGTIDKTGSLFNGVTITDSPRELLSLQSDAIRNITGDTPSYASGNIHFSGAFKKGSYVGGLAGGTNRQYRTVLDVSRVIPTAEKNRVENYAVQAVRCI